MKKKDCIISHERQTLEKCVFCHKKINLSFKEKLDKRIAEIPHETKQQILDLFREGKTLGEIIKITGYEMLIVGNILTDNIDHSVISILRTEAKL